MSETGRKVIAFDNTGTLSEVVLSVAMVSEDDVFDRRVPDIPADRPAALIGIAIEDYEVFDVEGTVSGVLQRHEIPVHLALSNVETTDEAARQALLADQQTPARSIVAEVDSLRAHLRAERPSWRELPIGVQLSLELPDGPIHRVIAYTTVPRRDGAYVVSAVREAGWEAHVVSGDRAPILAAVSEALDIPSGRVHPDQSPPGKAATLESFRADGATEVVMVGDYKNDLAAFETADLAILIANEEADSHPALQEVADVVVSSLASVPDVL
jgi:soluble P-type ATPase